MFFESLPASLLKTVCMAAQLRFWTNARGKKTLQFLFWFATAYSCAKLPKHVWEKGGTCRWTFESGCLVPFPFQANGCSSIHPNYPKTVLHIVTAHSIGALWNMMSTMRFCPRARTLEIDCKACGRNRPRNTAEWHCLARTLGIVQLSQLSVSIGTAEISAPLNRSQNHKRGRTHTHRDSSHNHKHNCLNIAKSTYRKAIRSLLYTPLRWTPPNFVEAWPGKTVRKNSEVNGGRDEFSHVFFYCTQVSTSLTWLCVELKTSSWWSMYHAYPVSLPKVVAASTWAITIIMRTALLLCLTGRS